MSYHNWTQILRNHGYLDPVTRQCIGDKCYAKVDMQTGILGCGHAVCEDCQNLAIVNHQPEDVAVRFYKDMRNFHGRDEATGMGDLAAVSSCLKRCTLAELKDVVTENACKDRKTSEIHCDEWRGGDKTIKRILAKNTIHMYEPGLIDFSETILANVDKLMLSQVRPKDHAISAHALYIWAHEQQPVGTLTKTISFIRYDRDFGLTRNTHDTFLWVPTSDKVFDWDKSLGEEFDRNQVIYTKIPF